MLTNPQLELAYEFVQHTNKNVFLTGKAGTGKTTFLHNLKKTSVKRMVVVAPTGVAAINAGGVTIHSFFQLAFGPHIPGGPASSAGEAANTGFNKKFSGDKIKLIRSLDLLVIDEISMVRADILDAIDEVLRRYRYSSKPFGGLQLLMIGDLHQLAPIVKDDEWQVLKPYYDTIYCFSSNALKQTDPVAVELKQIFRQSDEYFISLLNRVRENQLDFHTLQEINQRYIPGFKPDDDEGYITLTTHNNSAQRTNQSKLEALKTKSQFFTAEVEGDFPESSYPTEFKLELKEGAQVMFVKNDPSRSKLFFNGKIGKVVRFGEDVIYVKCPGDEREIAVTPLEWANTRYSLNTNKEVQENVIGKFTQFPLRLAWAITIHKSQGLTFEKAIIDASASFAHGQVYVALSRCKTFEGMVLSSRISNESVITDEMVAQHTKEINANVPGEEYLKQAKKNFQQGLLNELFDFTLVRKRFFYLKKVLEENSKSLEAGALEVLKSMIEPAKNEIQEVEEKFRSQLLQFIEEEILPEENLPLQERVKKASEYFADKLNAVLYEPSKNLSIESDNQGVKKQAMESLGKLQLELFSKIACLRSLTPGPPPTGGERGERTPGGFNAIKYLQAKANAENDFVADIKSSVKTKSDAPAQINHPKLYQQIKRWRDELADKMNIPIYRVVPSRTMVLLANHLPTSQNELRTIKGIGSAKMNQYGETLLKMIVAFCHENQINKKSVDTKIKFEEKDDKPKLKIDTKKVSYDLYKSGKSIQEIATERGFAIQTIEGHLFHYVETGDLPVKDFISEEKLNKIVSHLKQKDSIVTLSEVKNELGENYSYSEIRLAMKHAGLEKTKIE